MSGRPKSSTMTSGSNRPSASRHARPVLTACTSNPRARSRGVNAARMDGSSSTRRICAGTQAAPGCLVGPGTTISNSAPPPARLAARTLPCCASRSPRPIASPMPVPGWAPGSRTPEQGREHPLNLRRQEPGPRSRTVTRRPLWSTHAWTVTSVPGGAYLRRVVEHVAHSARRQPRIHTHRPRIGRVHAELPGHPAPDRRARRRHRRRRTV